MRNNKTFVIQLLAVALFVPSVWLYVKAGPDLFGEQFDLAALIDRKRFWLAFFAPFVWLGHASVILVAILKPIIDLGRSAPEPPDR